MRQQARSDSFSLGSCFQTAAFVAKGFMQGPELCLLPRPGVEIYAERRRLLCGRKRLGSGTQHAPRITGSGQRSCVRERL